MTDYISRADAIDELMKLPTDTIHSHFDDGYSLGIKHAIRTITTLPSADTVDVAHDIPEYCSWSQTYTNMVQSAMADTKSADAVQGEWIPIEETLPTYDGGEKTWLTGMKCSNCGKLFDLRVGYYYCPNCGARMKGERNG